MAPAVCLNVSALTSFTGIQNGFQNDSALTSTNGGTIEDDNLTNSCLRELESCRLDQSSRPADGLSPIRRPAIADSDSQLDVCRITGTADANGAWTEQVFAGNRCGR